MRVEAGDVDAAGPVDAEGVLTSTVRLEDTSDEDCFVIDDSDGGSLSFTVSSLFVCSQPRVTVRALDDNAVLATANQFCFVRLDVEVDEPVLVCTRTDGQQQNIQQRVEITLDDVTGLTTGPVGAPLPLGGQHTVSLGNNADRDCVASTNPTVNELTMSFGDQLACRDRSVSVFGASGFIHSHTDCRPPTGFLAPVGTITACASGGASTATLLLDVDPDADLVTSIAAPFVARPVAATTDADCRRVSIPAVGVWDISVTPTGTATPLTAAACAGDAQLFVTNTAAALITDSRAHACTGVSSFLAAGDVFVCLDTGRESVLSVRREEERTVVRPEGRCVSAFEGEFMELACPAGDIASIDFASYGINSGSCGDGIGEVPGGAFDVRDALASCVGLDRCEVNVSTQALGDPAPSFFKHLDAAFSYSQTPLPTHQWTFNGTADDVVGDADLVLLNGATISGGALVLDGVDDHARSADLPGGHFERTLVAWVTPQNVQQAFGGVATIDDGQGTFDGIAFSAGTAGQWTSSSDGFTRTFFDNGGAAEVGGARVQIAMRMIPGEGVQIFRNGERYGVRQGVFVVDYQGGAHHVLFGAHSEDNLTFTGGATDFDAFFAGAIDEVRLFDVALSQAELRALTPVP